MDFNKPAAEAAPSEDEDDSPLDDDKIKELLQGLDDD